MMRKGRMKALCLVLTIVWAFLLQCGMFLSLPIPQIIAIPIAGIVGMIEGATLYLILSRYHTKSALRCKVVH